jgi:hypothetical protein
MADSQLSKSFVTTAQTHRVFVYGTLRHDIAITLYSK